MKKKSVGIIAALWVCFLCMHCGNNNVVSVDTSKLVLPKDTATPYQLSKRFFLLVPGDTALFYGSRACTVITNGSLISATTDSLYYRTITQDSRLLTINDTTMLVIPQLFQEAATFSSLDTGGILRYFDPTPKGIMQPAYVQNGTTRYLPKRLQTVIPNPLAVGYFAVPNPNNNWVASPLISLPLAITTGSMVFEGQCVATTVMNVNVIFAPYVVRGCDYWDGVEIRTYYTLNAETKENGKDVLILGTVVVRCHYFKEIGLVERTRVMTIRKCFSDGGIELTKEADYVGRGPDGAKRYLDYNPY